MTTLVHALHILRTLIKRRASHLHATATVCTQPVNRPLFSLNKGPTGVFKSVLETSRTEGKVRS